MNTKANFIPGQYYHVYNRTNNGEVLFKEDENRVFFLKRFNSYLRPFCIVHAYVLMGNHFHYSIQVREVDVIVRNINNLPKSRVTRSMKLLIESLSGEESLIHGLVNDLLLSQFQNFFNSYAKAINKKYDRVGSLFQKGFKRSLYNPDDKFQYLMYYITIMHGSMELYRVFLDYPNHSYYDILDDNNSYIDVDEVLRWFDSLDDFISFHNADQYRERFEDIDIDDFL